MISVPPSLSIAHSRHVVVCTSGAVLLYCADGGVPPRRRGARSRILPLREARQLQRSVSVDSPVPGLLLCDLSIQSWADGLAMGESPSVDQCEAVWIRVTSELWPMGSH